MPHNEWVRAITRITNDLSLTTTRFSTTGSIVTRTRIALLFSVLCSVLCCTVTASSQLGANCGEHPNLFRNHAGIVWFTAEQLEKMAIKRVVPVTPPSAAGFQYDGFVTFKILVNTKGEISCIWGSAGNSLFLTAVNEALQYWRFKPMLANGKPVEFVGMAKFHVHSD